MEAVWRGDLVPNFSAFSQPFLVPLTSITGESKHARAAFLSLELGNKVQDLDHLYSSGIQTPNLLLIPPPESHTVLDRRLFGAVGTTFL